ncbi:histone-lysine N-methyltransferase TRX1 isoform X3 [Sorghum bicolor]|uniref:histone-lysine N-methyltransferase TRX1 isoform X3 n=1 Tax=Sorghum bicolor TaxID=4558 RepID=UPI000B4265BF|nr:histone-lysine N-methyltransferase TRX1 isoform X3 [Sorghum bicolor]|eukprot:XP_021308614.1 histone-lysine N-methyltransferase TRX1 isoform X3 [Sorghum bicolor]
MVIAVEGNGFVHDEEEEDGDRPIRYLPLGHVYSSSAPAPRPPVQKKPRFDDLNPPMKVYYRRRRKKLRVDDSLSPPSPTTAPLAPLERDEEAGPSCRKGSLKHDLLSLSSASPALDGDGKEPERRRGRTRRSGGAEKTVCFSEPERRGPCRPKGSVGRRWVELDIQTADPNAFVGLVCKVFWPLDDDWYKGSITWYNEATKKHSVKYDDGEAEDLSLADERIKFSISSEEMKSLNLKFGISNQDKKGHDELLALAVSFHDYQGLDPGDLVWAKITGHAMWPAVVVDESNVPATRALKSIRLDQSILVQFFGTHDFARIKLKQAVPFLNGLVSSLHLKCKQTSFSRSLEEAKEFLSTQQLPEIMLQLRKSVQHDGSVVNSYEDKVNPCGNLSEDLAVQNGEDVQMTQIELGNLRVSNLGRIVSDSDHFHNKRDIWPEGYTAFRKYMSIADPHSVTSYKMEVLRNSDTKARPLFRVISEDGVQIDGSTPNACWKEIYSRIKEKQCNTATELERNVCQKSGSYMFGFSNPQIRQLIQELPNARSCLKYFENSGDTILGYRAVHVNWKDLDCCNVCDMDEEYEDNLFLQCDKCRMMVHARCYGELKQLDGGLWLCNLCRPGAPRVSPKCCLCPVTGGAMKPTTDGRWAHLACAIWIPETCLKDVKRMEPIDGLSRINKDRWKLVCSICGVSYGVCIQCSHPTCRVAYHPLCARAADLCIELENDDKIHHMYLDEDDDPCIRLLSYCKKHRQPSAERPSLESDPAEPVQVVQTDVVSSSGCARTEPYNFRRRGQKQPQIVSTASLKRLYLENRPYIVSGYCQNRVGNACSESLQPVGLSDAVQQEAIGNVSSMVEKYTIMKATFRKRLTFGKSKIHGFGVFAKVAHKAGDMMIEYIGEIVRPPISDTRERRIYNSLVGAGTYMFRIDDERVIDATRAGSIAHLINHSCEPNCYSRAITILGDEHIIIFAKRDIDPWEELTYDYRFFFE